MEFIGKYFLLGAIHTNAEYVVFFLFVGFIVVTAVILYMLLSEIDEGTHKLVNLLISTSVVLFGLSLLWLFVGDSFWFTGKVSIWVRSIRI